MSIFKKFIFFGNHYCDSRLALQIQEGRPSEKKKHPVYQSCWGRVQKPLGRANMSTIVWLFMGKVLFK